MNTFSCHCGAQVTDNGGYSCGVCPQCGTFFHAMQRLLPGYDPTHDPYGWVFESLTDLVSLVDGSDED